MFVRGGHEMESRDIGSCCGYQPNKDWLSVKPFSGPMMTALSSQSSICVALDMPDDLRNWPSFMARPLAARAAAPAASVR